MLMKRSRPSLVQGQHDVAQLGADEGELLHTAIRHVTHQIQNLLETGFVSLPKIQQCRRDVLSGSLELRVSLGNVFAHERGDRVAVEDRFQCGPDRGRHPENGAFDLVLSGQGGRELAQNGPVVTKGHRAVPAPLAGVHLCPQARLVSIRLAGFEEHRLFFLPPIVTPGPCRDSLRMRRVGRTSTPTS